MCSARSISSIWKRSVSRFSNTSVTRSPTCTRRARLISMMRLRKSSRTLVYSVGPRTSRRSILPIFGMRVAGSGPERIEPLLEAAGVGPLGARERLEPFGDLLEALVARRLGEAGIHLGVLVGLAGDGGLEVLVGVADGLAGGGVADLAEKIEMSVRVAGLPLGGVAEQAGDVRVAFHVGVLGEIEITAVGLGLSSERR